MLLFLNSKRGKVIWSAESESLGQQHALDDNNSQRGVNVQWKHLSSLQRWNFIKGTVTLISLLQCSKINSFDQCKWRRNNEVWMKRSLDPSSASHTHKHKKMPMRAFTFNVYRCEIWQIWFFTQMFICLESFPHNPKFMLTKRKRKPSDILNVRASTTFAPFTDKRMLS